MTILPIAYAIYHSLDRRDQAAKTILTVRGNARVLCELKPSVRQHPTMGNEPAHSGTRGRCPGPRISCPPPRPWQVKTACVSLFALHRVQGGAQGEDPPEDLAHFRRFRGSLRQLMKALRLLLTRDLTQEELQLVGQVEVRCLAALHETTEARFLGNEAAYYQASRCLQAVHQGATQLLTVRPVGSARG